MYGLKAVSAKRERFCREYVIDLNATQAAIRAGYSARSADVQGTQLLGIPSVAARVAELQAEIRNRLDISADRIILEMARIALSDARRLFRDDGSLRPVAEWDDETAAAVSGVDVTEEFDGRGDNRTLSGYTRKVKLWDKVQALVKLGQHLGVFKERVEHSGLNGSPIAFVEVVRSGRSSE